MTNHIAQCYFALQLSFTKDFSPLSEMELAMPIRSFVGAKSMGRQRRQRMKSLAHSPTFLVLKNTGYCLTEERRNETMDAPVKFL
jgi:hypothetical protein